MTDNQYQGPERRKFQRFIHVAPLAYKVCSEETITKLLQGYTSDLSQAGVLCQMKDKVKKDDILWLSFDRSTLLVCEDLEKRSFVYQNGIIGKVVRIEHTGEDNYDIGVQFITREEKNSSNIYPKFHFLKYQNISQDTKSDEEA